MENMAQVLLDNTNSLTAIVFVSPLIIYFVYKIIRSELDDIWDDISSDDGDFNFNPDSMTSLEFFKYAMKELSGEEEDTSSDSHAYTNNVDSYLDTLKSEIANDFLETLSKIIDAFYS